MTKKVGWRCFSDHFRELFQGLSHTNDYTDITLVSGDNQTFQVHTEKDLEGNDNRHGYGDITDRDPI